MRNILAISATALLFAVLTTASACAGTARAAGAPRPIDTVVIGQPIEPSDGDATIKTVAARAGVPMIETLTPVGPPIVPLAEAPVSATQVPMMERRRKTARVKRRIIVQEFCDVPMRRRARYSRYRW